MSFVPPDGKITLFRNLFSWAGGRLRRSVGGEGRKSGYSPAATMDWRAINAARPEERQRVARKTRVQKPQKKLCKIFWAGRSTFQAQRPHVKLRCGGYRDIPNWLDVIPMRGPGCVSGRRGDGFSRLAGG